MQVSQILTEIDNEIARLQQARNLLAGGSVSSPGREANKATPSGAKAPRTLSAEGRRKIGEAMKRRWMERRKQAAAKATKPAAAKAK